MSDGSGALPPYPVTVVGSWPRSEALLAVRAQEAAGVDVVSDGEQRRDNFYSFVAEKLEGVTSMTLAELLEHVEDREGFRRLLDSLDVPAYSIRNPTCTGRLRLRESLALDEVRFLRGVTARPLKVALPGPYLLTRAMWVQEVSRASYPTKEALGDDVVAILRGELGRLAAADVEFVQLDEPVLTELVFSQGRTRTFMCAALAARRDPREELEFATSLIGRVVEGFEDRRIGLHVCRGNWSRDERTLLSGSYAPLAPWFDRLGVRQLVLEYATPRAGPVVPVGTKELGLGVVNPRTPEVETEDEIVERVRRARAQVPAERLFLNPDCGFGSFSSRAMNPPQIAQAKLAVMARAARRLREGG